VANRKKNRHYKRGYPVAVLIGFEEKRAVLWQIFSRVVESHVTVELDGKDKKDLYNFHESTVDALRPLLKEGIRSIVVTTPMKKRYGRNFLDHVRKRHPWLIREYDANTAVFGELVGSAGQFHEVSDLVKTEEFRKVLSKITSEDVDHIVDALEKRLNELDSSTVLYSIEEMEELVNRQLGRGNLMPKYIVLTDRYLANTREKNRVHRLLQISKNKHIMTRIVNVETKAGFRISQLGGLVCFTELEQ
jgi:stalled ribosome rescue protein Dom34